MIRSRSTTPGDGFVGSFLGSASMNFSGPDDPHHQDDPDSRVLPVPFG